MSNEYQKENSVPTVAELEKTPALFHISDVLSLLYDVPASLNTANFRKGEMPITRQKDDYRSYAGISNLGNTKLTSHLFGVSNVDDTRLEQAKQAIIKTYPILQTVTPPPVEPKSVRRAAYYEYREALRNWVDAQEKQIGKSWFAISPVRVPKSAAINMHSYFPNVTEDEAKYFGYFEQPAVAQAVFSLGKLHKKRDFIPADEIKSRTDAQGENFVVISCTNEDQAERRFNNLRTHFDRVGASDLIKLVSETTPDADDGYSTDYFIVVKADWLVSEKNDKNQSLLRKLMSYVQNQAEEQVLDKIHGKGRG